MCRSIYPVLPLNLPNFVLCENNDILNYETSWHGPHMGGASEPEVVNTSILISNRNIEHIAGIIFHICLWSKNIAGGNICRGYSVGTVHWMSKRLAEHHRRWPMRERSWVGYKGVSGRLCRIRRITNVWSVRVIVAMVTITMCPALGRQACCRVTSGCWNRWLMGNQWNIRVFPWKKNDARHVSVVIFKHSLPNTTETGEKKPPK